MAFWCMAFIRFSIAGFGMFSANLSVCVICASNLLGVVYNEFGNLWCMFLLDSHLSMYVKLSLATWVSLFLCSLLMKLCRFRMEPSCVVDGTLVSQYGFECAMCIGGFLCL